MEIEEFETVRDFKRKFPVELYICPMCKKAVTSSIYCRYCGFRADGIVKTLEQGYKYRIKEQGNEINEIFRPVEYGEKEERNKRCQTKN